MGAGGWPPLNQTQLRTLRWIADGCPDGVMVGETHKISARALQGRRLVKIARHGGRWSATMTDAGWYYLDHGAYPAAPSVTSTTPQSVVEPSKPKQATAYGEGPTGAMIDALLRQDGRIEIAPSEADRYERLARAASRSKKVPVGQRVRVERDWQARKAWVVLEALPSWMTATLDPVPVAASLRQPTDVAAALRDREDLDVRRSERQRGLRILDALVREARRRGNTVRTTAAPRRNSWGYVERSEDDRGHVVIALGPDQYRLTMSQQKAKVPHVPTEAEAARAARGYASIPRFDTVVTEHLRLIIEGNEAPFWRSEWSDKQGPPLEESLAQVLQELELRHDRAEQRRRDEVRQHEERKRQWELARAAAVQQLIQSHRARVLQEQVRAWELATSLCAYVAAMEARIAGCADPDEREAAEQWLRWAREYAEQVDPLNRVLRMPTDPKPTAEALAPFMKGWDPNGPH
jgi:hypothetical protein